MAGSEVVLYQDPQNARCRAPRRGDQLRQRRQALHHDRRALRPARCVAVADEPARQDPADQYGRHDADRQPVLRRRRAELRRDLGAAACAIHSAPSTTRRPDGCFIGDVGGNDYSTAKEEVNLGVARRELRLAELRGQLRRTRYTSSALCVSATTAATAGVTGGFVYRGSQFPSQYHGQLLLRRLRPELDQAADVRRQRQRRPASFNFEPPDGARRAVRRHRRISTEGPDGALYYVDLGYSDTTGTSASARSAGSGTSQTTSRPSAIASADTAAGPAPLDGQLLERRLVRSGGAAADLLVDVRRRRDVDRGQPAHTLRAGRALHGAAHRLRRGQHHALAADHDQRRQPAQSPRS